MVDARASGEARGLQSRILSTGVCRHRCAHHVEVMDPSVWSRLPEHLLAHVFARMTMPQILSLGWLSKAWLAMSKTSSFKRMCAEVHSRTFGVLGFHRSSDRFQVAAFDLAKRQWMYRELKHFPRGYRDGTSMLLQPASPGGLADSVEDHLDNALYAHDGGLVCFASTKNVPMLVCNPLTNEWKTLPSIDLITWLPIMVQLVTETGAGGYRLMVVCRRREVELDYDSDPGSRNRGVYGSETAKVYDSKTGRWSTMTSGSVYGLDHTELNLPKVFNCVARTLIGLCHRSCLKRTLLIDSTIVKGHVLALHAHANRGMGDNIGAVYEISELVDQEGSPGTLRVLNHYKSTLGSEYNNYTTLLFATEGFILLVSDNGEENFGEFHHQLVRLFDVSCREWHKLPVLNDIYTVESTSNHFMCELRWDAFP